MKEFRILMKTEGEFNALVKTKYLKIMSGKIMLGFMQQLIQIYDKFI